MPQIECPSCQTRYEVPALSLPEEGRKVRCSVCKALWIATAHVEQDLLTAIPEITIDAPVAATEVVVHAPADIGMISVGGPQFAEPQRARRPWQQRMAMPVIKRPSRFSWQALATLGVAALMMASIGLRRQIVAFVPDTGKAFAAIGLPVNLRGLEFRDIRSGVLSEDKSELLVVQGEIFNVSKVRQPLPRLKFSVRDAKGIEVYAWTAQADGKDLQPGQSLTFRRRLASPPPEGVEVLVRFATRTDLMAMGPNGGL